MFLTPETQVATEQLIQTNVNETSRFQEIIKHSRRVLGRAALVLTLAAGTTVALSATESITGHAPIAEAATNTYPDGDAQDYNVANYDWWKDEDGNGVYSGSGELLSSRGYAYRNCTDWAAFRANQLTGISIPSNLGNADTWDNNAPSGWVVDTTPEAGDVAQSEGGTYGHIGVVENVNKNSQGIVTSIEVSEYNKAGNGEYSDNIYTPDNNGTFWRDSAHTKKWDHFLDLNGTGVTSSGGSSGGSSPDLHILQHQNSNSGMTEDRRVDANSNYTSWVGGWVTPDGVHSGADVDYGMADYNGDGAQDIYKIQHQNTNSGMTEVAVMNGAANNTGWQGGWSTPDGLHSGNDVHYSVGDYNRDGKPDVYVIQHWNTGSGKIEVKILNGATNFTSWIGGWVTPEGWHGGDDVDFALSTCGTTGAPHLYEILHNNTGSGMVEVKKLNGATNYTTWVGGWTTPEGMHSGADVHYTAAGCNTNGQPNIYEIQHGSTNSGMTEVKELNGANNFGSWVGGWTTPDGLHSGDDVDYVMPQ